MIESPIGADYEIDYERYVRGCIRLDWKPLPSDEFLREYGRYWDAKRAMERFDYRSRPGLDWSDRAPAPYLHAGNRETQVVRQLGDLYWAVLSGMDSEGDGGTKDCGVTAPLLTGPFSRSGEERLEFPVEFFEESAA